MTQSRQRREKPEPISPEDEAEIEAKYRLLHRRLKRFAARMRAKEARDAAPPPAAQRRVIP